MNAGGATVAEGSRVCSEPTGDPGRLGMARANCCPQLARASCRPIVGPGQLWILTSTDGSPFLAMHKGHIFGSIKLANVLGIKLLEVFP